MAARPAPPPVRLPVLLAVVLLVAIALGVAATFLSAPVQPAPPSTPQDRTSTLSTNVGEIGAALLIALVALLIIGRLSMGRSTGVGRYTVNMLMIFAVAILFVVLLHLVSSGGDTGTLTAGNESNGTGNPPGGPGTLLNNSTAPPDFLPIIPVWAGYAGLVVAAIVAVIVVVPLARASRRGGSGPPLAIAPVQRSLEGALAALGTPGAEDPRATIIALYAELLRALTPYLEEVEAATPREIERECVQRFQLQPANARALTALFEEARYSTHPFSTDQVERARAALTAALADLEVPKAVAA